MAVRDHARRNDSCGPTNCERLIRPKVFTCTDPQFEVPAMNESATNAPPCINCCRDHRSAADPPDQTIFWWCYAFYPLPTSPDPRNHALNTQIEAQWEHAAHTPRQCHPQMGRRHRLARPPPHKPPPETTGLTLHNSFCP